MATDRDVFARINDLAHEEEELYGRASDGSGLAPDEVGRLEEIKVELDQCYDLLHQRQGRRDAGEDPREAELRPPNVVEGYEQ
jgi:hypothetical protein